MDKNWSKRWKEFPIILDLRQLSKKEKKKKKKKLHNEQQKWEILINAGGEYSNEGINFMFLRIEKQKQNLRITSSTLSVFYRFSEFSGFSAKMHRHLPLPRSFFQQLVLSTKQHRRKGGEELITAEAVNSTNYSE